MTSFDPILHDDEKRLKLLEAARRDLEDQMIVMAAMERRQTARMEEFEEFIAEQIQYEIEHEKEQKVREQRSEEWQERHELAMREFDDKLNGLIAFSDKERQEHAEHGAQLKEWQNRHELAMREFDDKLNGLIGWLDDFVKRNPKDGK